jgi:hypothetical protein
MPNAGSAALAAGTRVALRHPARNPKGSIMSNGSYYAEVGAAAVKYPREFIAQHESGHAVVRWALCQPFLKVTLDDPPCPMVLPLAGAVISSGPAMITAVAGGAAEMQLRGLVIRGSQIVKLLAGNGDERFELTDAVTGEVVVAPSRAMAVSPGGDLHYMANRIARDRWTSSMYIGFYRDAERFTAGCRPAIDAVAAALAELGDLSYAGVSERAAAAMEGHPAPAVPGWARAEVPDSTAR